jgi:glycosyltransferase involved in cell wall biosynthesis
MAAGTPVVSTTVGAEGLGVDPKRNIRIADSPELFAEACLELLEDAGEAARMARDAREMVAARFSWEQVTKEFEALLRGDRCYSYGGAA